MFKQIHQIFNSFSPSVTILKNDKAKLNLLKPKTYFVYIQKFCVLLANICVLFGTQNKQRLFLYTAITYWFL